MIAGLDDWPFEVSIFDKLNKQVQINTFQCEVANEILKWMF